MPKANYPRTRLKVPKEPIKPAKPMGLGPQPPPICTPEQLAFIEDAITGMIAKSRVALKDKSVTFRQIEAVVGYMIQRQQWNMTPSGS